MELTPDNKHLLPGTEVVAVDGEIVGTLATIVDGYLIVEQGRLFPKDYEISVDAVDAYDTAAGVVALSVTKAQMQLSGMGQRVEEPIAGALEPTATAD